MRAILGTVHRLARCGIGLLEVFPFVPVPVYKTCDLVLLVPVEVLPTAAKKLLKAFTAGIVRLPQMCLFYFQLLESISYVVHLIDCLDVGYDGHRGRESVVVCSHDVGQNLFHSLVVSGRLYLYGREMSCGVYDVDVKVSDFYLVAFLLTVSVVVIGEDRADFELWIKLFTFDMDFGPPSEFSPLASRINFTLADHTPECRTRLQKALMPFVLGVIHYSRCNFIDDL